MSEFTRTVYLVVLNDGTDEINNLHSLEVVLSSKKTAYASVWAALYGAYMDEVYPACDLCGDGNAYKALPRPSRVVRTNNNGYIADQNYINDCCGEMRLKLHETIEDPIGRSFLPILFNPDAQPLGVDSIMDAMADNPAAQAAFMPLSSVLHTLDVWRGLASEQE